MERAGMTYQDQIDNIMDTFDFAEVAEIMAAIDWKWGEDRHTPDEPELRASARKSLRALLDDNSLCNSGGFTATKHDGQINLYWGIDSHTVTDGCWLEDCEE
jgi:hypothetical protein